MPSNIFGNQDALIGSIDLAVGAIMVLGSLILRKQINDNMGRGFSIIGSSVCGILTYLLVSNIFNVMKISVGLGIVAWAAGGFLLADIIGDGESK